MCAIVHRLPAFAVWVLLFSGSARAATETTIVTATADAQPLSELALPVSILFGDELERVGAVHPGELFFRFPGVWVSRGSGQEHLTALRSPVLTGAGACGAVLILEDDVPLRPPGFCNVNGLMEVNTEQAGSIEVLRGPGTAVHGSSALHGVIHVRSPGPANASAAVQAERGSRGLVRLRGAVGGNPSLRALAVRADSFRRGEGFEQVKLNLQHHRSLASGDWTTTLSVTELQQDTAGFVVGRDAYRDSERRRSNPSPNAFRDARALRLAGHWRHVGPGGDEWNLTPFARRTRMRFVQHFLPGTPLEDNGHTSAGVLLSWRRTALPWRFALGTDLQVADTWLVEDQAAPVDSPSPFLVETRPAGRHYDYRVRIGAASLWTQARYQLSPRSAFHAGLRVERLFYRYDNRLLPGNRRADGSQCGFGGCLFSRPADRSDRFGGVLPKLGLTVDFARHTAYLRLARGYRPPQVTELYRLQRNQRVAELDSERIDALDMGLRGRAGNVDFDLALYAMRKYNVILRDAQGFNLSDGRTRHHGLELSLRADLGPSLNLSLSASAARHRYAFDRSAAQGEIIRAGNDVDSAPRRIASARLLWQPHPGGSLELEWQGLSAYFLDAENRRRYPGHSLWHLRADLRLGRGWWLFGRLTNLADRRYAERADFAFGQYRYLPGAGRSGFAGLRYTPGRP